LAYFINKQNSFNDLARFIILVGLVCLTNASFALASNDCSSTNSLRNFQNYFASSPFPHQEASQYMEQCLLTFGRDYKSSQYSTQLKSQMDPTQIDQVINALSQGQYTQDNTDKPILENLQRYVTTTFEQCQREQAYINASTGFSGTAGFPAEQTRYVDLCTKHFRLTRINLVQVPPTELNAGTVYADIEASCNTAGYALACAIGCQTTDGSLDGSNTPYCDQLGRANETLRRLAIACAAGHRQEPVPRECQQLCERESGSCLPGLREGEIVVAGADDGEDREGPREPTPPGTDGDPQPVDPIAEAPSTPESPEADPNDPANTLPGLANTLGNMMMPMMNQGVQGNTNVPQSNPGSQLQASAVSAGQAANPRVSGPTGGVHFPASGTLPPQREGFPRGSGNNGEGGAPPGGGGPMGMPMGGMMGGGGSAGIGGGGNMPKAGSGGGGGRRSSALRPIADGLGGNNYMGADGARGSNSKVVEAASGNPEKNKASKGKDVPKDQRAKVNQALRNQLSRRGVFDGQGLAPTHYFPSVHGAYERLKNQNDVID
jgi:hypothetical protein